MKEPHSVIQPGTFRNMRRFLALRLLSWLPARPHSRIFHSTALSQIPLPIPVPTSSPPTPKSSLNSPLPVTPQCPAPRCPCESAPEGLDIDRTTPLNGTMPPYSRHLLISTGKSDWASKIEFDSPSPSASDSDPGGLAAQVKAIAAQKGSNLRDPFAPTLITNSSFSGSGAYVFPTGIYIPHIPRTTSDITTLIRHFLLPPLAPAASFPAARRVRETVVLICSHMSRDVRCGTLAPLLRSHFDAILERQGVLLTPADEARGGYKGRVKVGYTSHLSGHKFAGNVVVYLPSPQGDGRGIGVWYGRVEPRHVEGIVEETVLGRRVIGELCRGVVGG